MGGVNEQEEFVKAAIGASTRTRQLMFFSQVFGLVVLVVQFNTDVTRWARARSRLAEMGHIAYRCKNLPKDVIFQMPPGSADPAPSAAPPEPLRPVFLPPKPTPTGDWGWFLHSSAEEQVRKGNDESGKKAAEAWAKACSEDKDFLNSRIPPERIKEVARWILRNRMSSSQVDAAISRFDDFERDNVFTIPVPLTGLRIDVNDFGLLGGIMHLSILMSLVVAYFREREAFERVAQDFKDAARAHNFFGNLPKPEGKDGAEKYAPLWEAGMMIGFALLFIGNVAWFGLGKKMSPFAPVLHVVLFGLSLLILFLALWRAGKKSFAETISRIAAVVAVSLPLIVFAFLVRNDTYDAPIYAEIFPKIVPVVTAESVLFALNAAVTLGIFAFWVNWGAIFKSNAPKPS